MFTKKILARKLISDDLASFLSKAAIIPIEEIRMHDSLDHLGVDSAAMISLSVYIEEQYGVMTNANNLPKTITIERLVDFITCERERHCN